MVFTNLQPFPHAMTPLTNISPLTYRDGITFLEKLERMRQWLNETMVPDTNAALANAIDEFQTGIENAEQTVLTAKAGWQATFNEFSATLNSAFDAFKNATNEIIADAQTDITAQKAEWQASFNDFMANVEAELAALNDSAVAGLVGDTGTETGLALDQRYGFHVTPSGITAGTGDVARINAALATGNVILRGIYYTNSPIRIPSNRTLTLADAEIHLVAGSNCNVIQNYDQTLAGNANIVLQGVGKAVIDGGNSLTQTTASAYNSIGVTFTSVQNLVVRDLKIGPARGPVMVLQGVTKGRVSRIDIAQDRSGANQDGIDLGPANVDVIIDGISGVTGDDLFSLFSQKTAGFGHGIYKTPEFAGHMTDITIRNAAVDVGINPVRVQAGDGLELHRVNIENITNLNNNTVGNNYSVIAFGELSYVTTPPLKAHLSDISFRGYRGRANVVIGAHSHFSKVRVSDVVVTTPVKAILGIAQSVVSVASDTEDLELSNIRLTDASTSSTGSLVGLPTGSTCAGLIIDNWTVRRCQAVFNSAGTITSVSANNIRIRNLLGAICASSTAETGYIDNVIVQNSGVARYIGAAAKLIFGQNMPRFLPADTIPVASKGSQITAQAGFAPAGDAFANGATYTANGATWVRTADLGASF